MNITRPSNKKNYLHSGTRITFTSVSMTKLYVSSKFGVAESFATLRNAPEHHNLFSNSSSKLNGVSISLNNDLKVMVDRSTEHATYSFV